MCSDGALVGRSYRDFFNKLSCGPLEVEGRSYRGFSVMRSDCALEGRSCPDFFSHASLWPIGRAHLSRIFGHGEGAATEIFFASFLVARWKGAAIKNFRSCVPMALWKGAATDFFLISFLVAHWKGAANEDSRS